MAVCVLSKDILKSTSCAYSLPEITDIYLANFNDVSAVTLNASGNAVSAISMSATSKFYHIEPAKNSVTFTDALQVGDSGNKYRNHSISFTINGAYDSEMVNVLDALSLGRYIGVVKTAEGTYLMIGRTAGLEATDTDTANLQGGETNGLSFTLNANATEASLPLLEGAVATVLGQ